MTSIQTGPTWRGRRTLHSEKGFLMHEELVVNCPGDQNPRAVVWVCLCGLLEERKKREELF